MSAPVVVIGTGPVGIRFVRELRKLDANRPIVVFGNEPWQPYNRVKLSSLLANEMSWDNIVSQDWQAIKDDPNTTTHLNCPITDIDRIDQTVTDANGDVHQYSELVLAIGSRPFLPQIEGINATGVYTFRDLNDVQALFARSVRSRHVCVLGGGLLGLETAKALNRHNTKVTVIQRSDHLMNNQLDEVGAARLRKSVETMGIEVRCGEGVTEVMAENSVIGVKLRSGDTIACDTVVVATGIRPNKELGLNIGLTVGYGIKVNDSLQTNDPNIYAIGECSEHKGQTYGLVAPGFEQASVAARHIVDSEHPSSYLGSTTATELKVVGEKVFSIGELTAPRAPFAQEVVFEDGDSYRKLVINKSKIIGAQAIGDWPESRRVQEALTKERRIWPWDIWRFKLKGQLFSSSDNDVAGWPEETLVCQCMAVPRGTLSECMMTCSTVEQVGEETGAGTVCGSCKPLIAQLLGQEAKREPDPKWKALVQTCSMTLLLSLVFLLIPAFAYSLSVQGMNIDQLWIDGLYKQITGYSLLTLSVFITLLSLRKRFTKFTWLEYPIWRVIHSALGVVLLMVLVTHTGLQLGSGINFALMSSYLAVSLVGVGAGIAVALEHKMSAEQATTVRKLSYWGHVLASWPLPALLTFHIISVYYF